MDTIEAYLINCRLCASSLNKGKKILIFDSNCDDNQSSELCDTIYNFLEIQITKEDNLPKIMCYKCYRMINSIKTFKRKCHKAETELRKKIISSINVKQCDEEEDVPVQDDNDGEHVSENNPIDYVSTSLQSVESDNKLEDQKCSYISQSESKDEDEEILDSPAEDLGNVSSEPEIKKPTKKLKKKSKPKQKTKTKKELEIDDDFPKIVKKRKRVKTVNVCEVCGIFTKRLSEHMTVHLKIRFNCPMCSKSYPHKATLWRHLLTHNDKKFSCEHCAMRFTCHDYLKRHLLVHTGERNHVCEICNKAFQTKYNLKTHMRTHTKEKPFICPNCNDAFAHRAAYNTHTRDCNNKYLNNTGFVLAI